MNEVPSQPGYDHARRSRRRARTATLVLTLILTVALTACSATRTRYVPTATARPDAAVTTAATPTTAPPTPTATTAVPTAVATPTSLPTATPSLPSLLATPVPTASPAASPTITGTPSTADADAIKAVITKGNQEQAQALAANDPTLMQDTATPSYYNELVQTLSDLTNSGVTKIELLKLEWGQIGLTGDTTALAVTTETWRTTFSDNGVLEGPDKNVYTLVKTNGAWKVQTDDHPGSRPSQPTPSKPGVSPTPSPATTPVSPGQSRNWAGYSVSSGTFTAVTGTWTVPNVAATTTGSADATWVGIGGVDTHDLIQAGTDASVVRGQVSYEAWVEMLPQVVQPVPLDVAAGDKVTVSITQQPDGTWLIVIKDLTTNYVYQVPETYASLRSSAEWIEEAPAAGRRTQLPLDNFGSVTFTDSTTVKNGKQQTIAQAGGQAITMYGTGGQAVAVPSGLGADGASFTVTRTGAIGSIGP